MKIQTFSILAGSEACNAQCPFCVSRMTPPNGVKINGPKVKWRNFNIACRLARQCGVTTAMITGKGEPTVFPNQITKYLKALQKFDFPLVELQSNGILISKKHSRYLSGWYKLGMTMIAISIVHYEAEKNRRIYVPHEKTYIDLPRLIQTIHEQGLSVRLSCIMANGFIDNRKKLQNLINFAKENGVEQLTVTPVGKPDNSVNKKAWNWVNKHHLTNRQLADITRYIEKNGFHLLTLFHGARVFDLNGQNICLNNCLSVHSGAEDMRNLIFFPDGHLRYYWQYSGAILL